MSSCCLSGFKWDGQPQGHEATLNNQGYYVAGSNAEVAVMMIHDLYGWTFPNIRLLADHFAAEVGATVYVPDFFGGEVLPADIINNPAEWAKLNLPEFMARNSKVVRAPEIKAFAEFLRTRHRRVGAIGYCYGGWAVFQLGAKTNSGSPLVDCIAAAHPTFLEKEEIRAIGVPVQIIAPEHDPQFTEELKTYAVTEIPKLGVPFDYQYFPGLHHGFSVRGNRQNEAEIKGMERAMRAAICWFKEWLVVA
ncbi:Alpha/Beta hydrolase protein [Sordaria brevicollis]|uniref:Alpha/Beta hydrolase protein n=1 Tax=Sordaria brevicollis TaxID=83679 RepID=A0AAE0PMI3_SORBR|nr:Alpha/Beta hydrolase protein [Sordaria brevicollis]